MTVGEYGRIAGTAIAAFVTLMFASLVVRGVSYVVVDGIDMPSGSTEWIIAAVVVGFVSWGMFLGVREMRQQDARWGRGLMLPTVLTVVSGLLLIPTVYQVADLTEAGPLGCIGDVCFGGIEPEDTAEKVALLADFAFTLTIFVASVYWLLTSMRKEEMRV